MSGERRIHLLRHGETTGLSSLRYFGSTDLALSDLGREQIRRVKPKIDPIPLRRVFRSEMLRVKQTTEIVLEGRGLEAIGHAALNEVDFGHLEGLTEGEIQEKFSTYWEEWRVEKRATCYPGGESFEGFRARVVEGAKALEREFGFEGETLIVAHRGVIRHLVAHFLGIDPAQARKHAPELGELITLQASGNSWEIAWRVL